MKLISTTLAACLLSGAAFAGAPVIDVQSEAGSVTLLRGAQVLDASNAQLQSNDVIVSAEGAAYELSLDNCSTLVEGESAIEMANVVCQDDEFYFFKDGQINPLVAFVGLTGGIFIISELADDDEDGAPASP